MTKHACAPTFYKRLLSWQLLLALGAVSLSGLAPAQDIEPEPYACCFTPIPPPCTGQGKRCAPAGVDPKLVGTWELRVRNPAGVSRWVWEIQRDGTYWFHAQGPGAPPAHHGSFEAHLGRYLLKSKTSKWIDQGDYQLEDRATLITRGRLGAGTWHRVQSKVTDRHETRSTAART